MVHWLKRNIALLLNQFQGVAHMSIRLYKFSMHQILKMKLPTMRLLRKKVNAPLPDYLNGQATLLKKSLWHGCFPVNFAKFLRTPFLQNDCFAFLMTCTNM